MPTIQVRGLEARSRLRTKGSDDRAPYREAIANLAGDQVLELIPEDGESLRKLKTLTSRAANEVGQGVKYGETEDGSLLVWLVSPTTTGKRRGRPLGRECADDGRRHTRQT